MFPDDEDIITSLNARREQGLADMERKYRSVCMTVARDITGSREDAEEVLNDLWLRVWNSIPPAHPQSLRRFLLALTRNLSLDRFRENHAAKRGSFADAVGELDECAEPADETPVPGQPAYDLGTALDEFVAGLEREERIPFLLRYWHGKPVKDIASALGLAPNTVTVRLRRTREKLRVFLKERGIQV